MIQCVAKSLCVLMIVLLCNQLGASEPLPSQSIQFLNTHCTDCHSGDDAEAGIQLDSDSAGTLTIDWTKHSSQQLWTKVHKAISDGVMPPSDAQQPTESDRSAMLDSLDKILTKYIPPGGTVLRRLNRQEYELSVRDVLKIPFSVPESFPADTQLHGFDNIGEGLVLSPPLMAQYLEVATAAADVLIPPQKAIVTATPKTTEVGPDAFTLNFTTGHQIDGVLRMVCSCDPLSRGSVWPNRFEAQYSGVYDVAIDLSPFKFTADHQPIVHLLARNTDGANFQKVSEMRKLAEFQITNDTRKTFTATVELMRGQTVVVHYDNAVLSSDQGPDFIPRTSGQLLEAFRDDPELGAAWMKAGYTRADRGWSWWKRIQAIRDAGDLDLDGFDPESKAVNDFAVLMARKGVNTIETMACMKFFKGPGVNIHRMSITGPMKVIEDDQARQQRLRTEKFLGDRGARNDKAYAASILRPMLQKAFRRPVAPEQLAKYIDMALRHQREGHRFQDGIHLAIRAALCSTNFLYRESRAGVLDEYDLAARLSYFLTSGPPDDALWKSARTGKLSSPKELERQTRRLLDHSRNKYFLDSFTGQWLGLRKLPEIMPDTRLLKWTDKDLRAVTLETEKFVAEILQKNHPIETFIDADFTYLNRRNANLYGIDFPKSDTLKRVTLSRSEPNARRRGGVLTHASVLMATANGVDTQPVLRGAWMLENIFGTPTPEPPADVPAIPPDTSGAKSIRDRLNRHMADASCARCHQKIDPPGFALESFDPVGRWREHYPVYKKKNDTVVTQDGQEVDTASEMADGTKLRDIVDLKKYLIENIDLFSRCLTGKLLVYATGRPLNYGDQKVVDTIVRDVKSDGNGFADLIVAVVQSESFRAR